MRKRTQAREVALKILYQLDITVQDTKVAFEGFLNSNEELGSDVKDFSYKLIVGTRDNLEAIDKNIKNFADNWELSRMAIVDRNILRLACFELMFMEDVPSKVTINEAVELAKKYGGIDSSKFVNGVLDKINKEDIKKS